MQDTAARLCSHGGQETFIRPLRSTERDTPDILHPDLNDQSNCCRGDNVQSKLLG